MDTITQLFIILFSIIGIESLLLMFIILKTPAIPFIKSFLLKRPIMYLMGKDKTGKFIPFKIRHGSGIVKNEGIYNLTENSHTLEENTKTALYFGFKDFAATVTPEYPALLQEIREKGYKINHINDLTSLIERVKADIESNPILDVKPYKTYKLHELQNMFPYNLDPTFIEAQVQGELIKFMKMMKATPQIMMGLIVLIIAAGVTVFIIQRAFKGCISQGDCSAMVSAAKCSFNGIQTIANLTPIVP